MQQVTKAHKNKWGSYKDRDNSYDDAQDILLFAQLVSNTPDLKDYIRSYLPKGEFTFRKHPYGKYEVDLALLNDNKEVVATFDVERWSEWREEWPWYYKWIHFLGRKEKFLADNFFMAYLNYNRTKVIIVDNKTIQPYPTINKFFKAKNVWDWVKEIPMNKGRIYGKGITNKEKMLFAESIE